MYLQIEIRIPDEFSREEQALYERLRAMWPARPNGISGIRIVRIGHHGATRPRSGIGTHRFIRNLNRRKTR